MRTPTQHWPPFHKFLHWLIAVCVIGLLAVGLYMTWIGYSPFKLQLYAVHKAIGLTVLGLVIIRMIERSLFKRPAQLSTHKPWERTVSHITHVLLYAALIGMPITGWIMSSAHNFPISFFGLFQVPDLVAPNAELAGFMEEVHELLGYGLMAAIALHIAGALKHHLIDRDVTLSRMLPRRGGAVALVMALAFLGFLSAAQLATNTSTPVERQPLTAEQDNTEFSEDDELAMINEAQMAPTDIAEWEIVNDRSSLVFTATQQGAKFDGQIEGMKGTIRFDADQLDNSMIDVTVDTNTIRTGSEDRDQYVTARDWFDVKNYPVARFRSDELIEGTEGGYMARGTMTIKGVARDFDLPFEVTFMQEDGQDMAKVAAEFTIRRLNYNIGEGQWEDTESVGNDVTVTLDLTAVKE